MTEQHPGWGGPRTPGLGKRLGRPPTSDQPTKRRTVWLTDAQFAYLRAIGGGSATRGVRVLLEQPTRPIPP